MNYLNERTENDILVIEFTVAAILDPLAVDSVWNELTTVLARSGKSKVIIDFSSVEFVSSGLLGALITFRSMGQARGFSFKLCGLKSEMKKIFSVTELDGLFRIYRTQKSAVESYAAESFVIRQELFARNDPEMIVAAESFDSIAVPAERVALLPAQNPFYSAFERSQQ